ncbi:MAG: response regulator transcription factor [Dehalococcoidia bacterium]|nr:response regulator transcription factor [Dehalococcoidia bacterium]
MTLEAPGIDVPAGEEVDAIRAMVIDSREAMREGLRMMLSGDERITVIGAVGDGQEAVQRLKELSPDIVVMDISLPGTQGLETLKKLKEARANIGIIVLSDDRKFLVPAIKAGAVGFLSRNISRSELAAAIQLIYLWRLVLFDDEVSHFALVKI